MQKNTKMTHLCIFRQVPFGFGDQTSYKLGKSEQGIAETPMNYRKFFDDRISDLKQEGRYRVFANLERLVGEFPDAIYHAPDGSSRRVTVWCNNDYLGMGQHPKVLTAMHDAISRSGAGAGGTEGVFE